MEIRASFWFFLFSVMLVLPSELVGQQPKISFEKYGVAEGLPERLVSSILQDEQGFIWFTTQNGLVKYDGYHFNTYEPTSQALDSTSLKLKNLSGGLIKGKDGKLWIGGILEPGGLACFDPRTETFRNYLHEPNNPHSKIPYLDAFPLLEDRWGNVWFTNGSFKLKKWMLCKWDTISGQAETFPYGITPRFDNSLSGSGGFAEAQEDGSIWVLDGDWNLRYWYPELDSFVIAHPSGTALPGWDRPDTISLIFAGLQSKLLLRGRKGVYVWDPVAKQVDQYYEHDPMNSNSPASGAINYVFEDHHGKYWLVQDNGNMTTIDPKSKLCSRHVYGKGKMVFSNGPATISHPQIYISDEQELIFRDRALDFKHFLQYDFETESFHLYDPNIKVPEYELLGNSPPFSMLKDKSNLLWVGYLGGLNKEAPKKQQMSFYTHKEGDPQSLPSEQIINIFEDAGGRIWIATREGLARYIADKDHFEPIAFAPQHTENQPIHQLIEDNDGKIWIAGAQGLFLWDEQASIARQVDLGSSDPQFISQIAEDKQQRLWVSVRGKGVYLLDIQSKQLQKTFQPIAGDSSSLLSNQIRDFFQDSRGRMWLGDPLGNQFGLFRYDESQERFIHYANRSQGQQSIGSNEIISIFEDDEQKIWVGTEDGLYYYQEELGGFERSGDPIQTSSITSYAKADKETIWLATYSGNGLVKFNPQAQEYQVFGKSAGLLHNDYASFSYPYKIALDSAGRVYYPNQVGLSVFDPATEQFKNYKEKDGFVIQDIFYVSFASKKGNIWLGTQKGLIRIIPANLIVRDSTMPEVHITAMTILDTTYFRPDGKLFKKAVSYTEEVSLSHTQNDLGFEFVALHYLSPEDNQYTWKLENYDEDWSQPSFKRSARYTNLNPGTYTFRVKASNADGLWNEQGTSLTITIHPPWWATWWARTLFALLISGILYSLYRFQVSRQLAQAENRRLKDLDAVKTSLYTNITHEFRTPLTVISGMASQIEPPQEAQNLIQRNSKHLLRLVNQMLDLAKLESGKLELNLQLGDITSYLHYLTESFHSYAETKDIELVFYAEDKEVVMDYDAEKIQHIISNLISNAVKFSHEGSKIILHMQREQQESSEALIIKVVDQGIGIAPDKLPHIFDRFYQVDDSSTRKGEGTGIGLTFTQELVHLMGGEITTESRVGEGSTFRLRLPISREAKQAETPPPPIPADGLLAFGGASLADALPINPELPQILIIEDNPDVITYIRSCLQDTYQLIEAENGAIGIEKAIEHVPDLIISDVMMPEKDGFEVCQTLKGDERSSHIPIILLTAKADVASRIAGLQEGADAYLAKPFDEKELRVRIEQLIQLRKSLMARYRELHGRPLVAEERYKREDGFVRKVNLLVEEHLSDDELNVEQIARKIGMSRSQLFRKLKALTGLSVSGFVREYRLERAKQLLKTSDLSIAEVAYEVGFKNPNHFSTVFKATFGTSPGATRK